MKKQLFFLGIVLFAIGLAGNAQDREDSKITVEITKEIDGEKKTFKGEYENEDQMRADPNYREFAGDDSFNFLFDRGDEDHDIFLHLDQLQDIGKPFFKFHFDDEDADNNFFFGPLHGDSASIHFFDDWDSKALQERLKEMDVEIQSLMDNEQEENRVSVVTSKKMKVTEVEGNEFGKKGEVSQNKRLKLDDLTFFPNPSANGRTKVKFKVPEEDELSIKVYNIKGKEVFNRYFDRFGGTYSETIDLSEQEDGMYLMEISLGKKRLTKKILIN